MTRSTKQNVKPALIAWAAITVFVLIATLIAATDNSFPTVHLAAAVHPGYESTPEQVQVQISPALAFAKTWSVGRVLGYIIWIAIGIFFAAIELDLIGNNEGTVGSFVASNPIVVFLLAALISLALIFTASSNKFARTTAPPISKERYDQIQDNKDSLKALFN
jgi:archaellum component FlaF (FlaF/FlaG flagellin family)